MAATLTESTFLANNTGSIATALKDAFTAMGYGAPIADFGTNPRVIVYEIVKDADKLYGKVYLELTITASGSFYVSQRLATDWDTGTDTPINPGDSSGQFQMYNPSTVTVRTLHTTEFQFVLLGYGEFDYWALIGVISPAAKPTYWDDDIAPYFFCSRLDYQAVNVWQMAGVNPYFYDSAIAADFDESHYPTTSNPFSLAPDVIPQLLFVPQSREGIAGLSSADFGRVGDSNLGQGTIVLLPDNSKYMVLGTYGATVPAIRVNLTSLEGRTVVNGILLSTVPTDGGNQGTICRFVDYGSYPTPTPCNYNALTVGQLFPG